MSLELPSVDRSPYPDSPPQPAATPGAEESGEMGYDLLLYGTEQVMRGSDNGVLVAFAALAFQQIRGGEPRPHYNVAFGFLIFSVLMCGVVHFAMGTVYVGRGRHLIRGQRERLRQRLSRGVYSTLAWSGRAGPAGVHPDWAATAAVPRAAGVAARLPVTLFPARVSRRGSDHGRFLVVVGEVSGAGRERETAKPQASARRWSQPLACPLFNGMLAALPVRVPSPPYLVRLATIAGGPDSGVRLSVDLETPAQTKVISPQTAASARRRTPPRPPCPATATTTASSRR